eukprot:1679222-Pyramimonas_sp.AAC.1
MPPQLRHHRLPQRNHYACRRLYGSSRPRQRDLSPSSLPPHPYRPCADATLRSSCRLSYLALPLPLQVLIALVALRTPQPTSAPPPPTPTR